MPLFHLLVVAALLGSDDPCVPPESVIITRMQAAIDALCHPEKVPPEFLQLARHDVAAQDAGILPELLRAMDQRPLVVVNWLRSAGEDILDRALRDRKPLPKDDLSAVLSDQELSEYPRKIALRWLERISPGIEARFLRDSLNDPVFSANAVDEVAELAEGLLAAGKTDETKALLLNAFKAARDPEQAQRVADALKLLGEKVDVHQQVGRVTQWYLIGPFSGQDQAGVAIAYPPEDRLDFSASYPGKSGPVSWRTISLGPNEAAVDLRRSLAETDDAVAYLAAVIDVDRDLEVELRAGADDNLRVWLNGRPVIDSRDFHQRLRLDKHRARVALSKGRNELLLKVCEIKLPPGPPSGSPPRWQASLRIVDLEGRAAPFVVERSATQPSKASASPR